MNTAMVRDVFLVTFWLFSMFYVWYDKVILTLLRKNFLTLFGLPYLLVHKPKIFGWFLIRFFQIEKFALSCHFCTLHDKSLILEAKIIYWNLVNFFKIFFQFDLYPGRLLREYIRLLFSQFKMYALKLTEECWPRKGFYFLKNAKEFCTASRTISTEKIGLRAKSLSERQRQTV